MTWEKGIDKMRQYADKQRFVWQKAAYLQEKYEFQEKIDVIVQAMEYFEKYLKQWELEKDES